LEEFNKELDEDYAILLTELTNQFESLVKNMDGNNYAEQSRNFLKPIASGNEKQFYAQIPKDEDFERRMVKLDTMIFKYNNYHSEDDLTYRCRANKPQSDFIHALETVKDCNNLILEYTTTIQEFGEIGPVLTAEGAITNFSDKDLNDPIIKRILAVEILLPYLSTISDKH
tara:strand:+ start:111983 stop:112495 length:513 start_codon:yes stop_codon:yes gene_type:complete